jgi:hypothetical protein
MYMFTGGGGSGVRLPDVPFDASNVFSFMIWIITTFGPIGQHLVEFVFTPWKDNAGNVYTLASILLNPGTLGLVWGAQALKAIFA